MKLSETMQDALRYAKWMSDGTWREGPWTTNRTSRALKARGLSDGFRLTEAGLAKREELLKGK